MGIAVHIGARVAARVEPDEVLLIFDTKNGTLWFRVMDFLRLRIQNCSFIQGKDQ